MLSQRRDIDLLFKLCLDVNVLSCWFGPSKQVSHLNMAGLLRRFVLASTTASVPTVSLTMSLGPSSWLDWDASIGNISGNRKGFTGLGGLGRRVKGVEEGRVEGREYGL